MPAHDAVPEIPKAALPAVETQPVFLSTEQLITELQPTEPRKAEAAVTSHELAVTVPVQHIHSDFQPLAANWLKMERRSWMILIGIVGGLLSLGWVTGLAIRQTLDVWQWLWLTLTVVINALLIWCAYFFPRRNFDATSWRLHPHGFEIRRGIWWRHRIFIPKDRIQHTDVHQGPIQRAYGLSSLVLNTGGTHEPSITLDGIDMPLAESLREQLSKRDPVPVQSRNDLRSS